MIDEESIRRIIQEELQKGLRKEGKRFLHTVLERVESLSVNFRDPAEEPEQPSPDPGPILSQMNERTEHAVYEQR